MRLLIDTQSFIWFSEDDKRLPTAVRTMMDDNTNSLVISIASFWEITIKMSLGKLILSENIETMINMAVNNGFEILPIKPTHLISLSALDLFHKDPFDRIIIAQAITENMSTISSDNIFSSYPVNNIWR
ncbi:MAG: type II toxin-antitoxin system VapC family toxin [Bacteroidales bacterium]|jgi:PIN domain nuclease of toxin-antitoxin system|nr:type II toxin-antitoxin system VapC family toxin [Bacteroidales bacterium]